MKRKTELKPSALPDRVLRAEIAKLERRPYDHLARWAVRLALLRDEQRERVGKG